MRVRKPLVLVVERDGHVAQPRVAALGARGDRRVQWVRDEESARQAIDGGRVDAMIAPLAAPGIDGLALLRRARAGYAHVCVILLADRADGAPAVAALHEGAAAVEPEAAPVEKLAALLEHGFERQAQATRFAEARARLDERFGVPHLAAQSPAMRRALEQVTRVAASRVPVLIEGPAGSGKRTIAQAIHQSGPRRLETFAWIQCDALPPDQAEAELFGRAGDGGDADRDDGAGGRFAAADRGTLYLGEVAALPPPAQAALLGALHDGGFMPAGGREQRRADVRLIAGTRKTLDAEAAAGRFRPDLLERLGVVIIRVPPLRQRFEDLPVLVETLLAEIGRGRGQKPRGITRGALDLLALHDWPGNVRELRQVLEAMAVLAEGRRTLTPSDLPARLLDREGPGRFTVSPGMSVAEVERRLIVATLEHARGDKRRAAELLGIGLRTLYRKLREFGLTGVAVRPRTRRTAPAARAGRRRRPRAGPRHPG